MCFYLFLFLHFSMIFLPTNFSGCSPNIFQKFTGVLVQTDHTKIRHYNAIRQCYIIVDQEVSPCTKYNAHMSICTNTFHATKWGKEHMSCTSLRPRRGQVPSYWSAGHLHQHAKSKSPQEAEAALRKLREKKCKPWQFVLSTCGRGRCKLGRRPELNGVR